MNSTKNIPFYLNLILIFLLPLFFIPFVPYSPVTAKAGLVFIFALVSFLFLAVNFLKEGRVETAKSFALLGTCGLGLAYLLSAVFSDSIKISLFGYGYEIDTFFSIATLSLLFFSTVSSIKTQKEIFYSFLAFLSSYVILALYQVVKVFSAPEFLSMGMFVGKTANLVGKWTDLSVISGLALVLSLASVELLKLARPFKVFLYFTSALSLFFLALIDLKIVWVAIGIVSLLLFIYNLSRNYRTTESGKRKLSIPVAAVFLVSVIFIVGGSNISNYISRSLGVASLEARPSWSSTITIAKSSISRNPVFGAGPNRFSSQWNLSKPTDVNSSPFWNADFNFGVGFLPSTVVSVGLLGLMAWIVFLTLSFAEGLKALFKKELDRTWEFFIFSSLISTAYLWALSVFYSPNIVVFALAFISTGILIASAKASGAIENLTFSFAENPRTSFVSVFLLVAVSVLVIAGGYIEAENLIAQANYQRGVLAASVYGDIDSAETAVLRANNLTPKDIYMRALSDLGIARLEMLASKQNVSEEVVRGEFQNILSFAITSAKGAISYDPTNYLNWLALGRVYESLVPLQVTGAYEEGLKVYNEALLRNPQNPAIYLLLARLEAAKGNNKVAKENINKALALKNNYTEAVFFLSQLEVAEGNIKGAIKSVEAAAVISPNDPAVFFQLGLLRYSEKNYEGAAGAFERAVSLNPVYSNAKYFLGLSYHYLGRTQDALVQFQDLVTLNPTNEEVKLVLSNLRAGRAPLANAKPPVDEDPEDREELPIEE